jgi:hypothetical protein
MKIFIFEKLKKIINYFFIFYKKFIKSKINIYFFYIMTKFLKFLSIFGPGRHAMSVGPKYGVLAYLRVERE